ncbi:MAG: polysaccharide biosynthesis/export family protein [Planctomycetes bacterium]|nr:polysaccharide biosynthesis/export family protein [Planctomycetota bacterium]
MNHIFSSLPLRGERKHSFVPLILLTVLVVPTFGCTDHRISLRDFLIIEQKVREANSAPPDEEAIAAAKELIDRRLGPYKVSPSDVLSVTFSALDDTALMTPQQVRVDRNGEIELPGVGKMSVADSELEDVENKIQDAYVPDIYRDVVVHVTLAETDTTNVLVTGAVTFPGFVSLRRTERNLLYAIVGAGGVSSLASGEVLLRRIRKPTEEVTLNLTEPEGLRAAFALDPLEAGDIITVEAALPSVIYVGGLVNAPSPQALPAGAHMSVLQAIAASGGLRTDVIPREATLIRRLPDGHDYHVKLDLDRINKAQDPNIMLAAGDILWVPETWDTRVEDFINRNIFLRAGVTISYNITGTEFLNRRGLQGRQFGGGNLQNSVDPLGFLNRGAALQALTP